MRDAIIEKLTQRLAKPPDSGAGVAYTLVEIRKLLERERRKADYKTLNFFCDWVVHVVLDRGATPELLSILDAHLSNLDLTNRHDVGPDIEIYRFMSFEWLQEELERFWKEMQLPNNWVSAPAFWAECVKFYGEIVADCALTVNRPDHAGKYIHRVVLTTVGLLPKEPEKESFRFDWEFTLNDGSAFKQSVEVTYPSVSSEVWKGRPTMTEFGF